jgi:lambda family phage portal protein
MSTTVIAPLFPGKSGSPQVLGDIYSQWGDSRESRLHRDRNLPSTGADADYRWRHDSAFYRQVEQARDMQNEDAVIGPSIRMSRRNVVGPNGFSLDPQTESKRFNQQVWERFTEYSNDKRECDVMGHRTFAQMCGLIYSQATVDGDIFPVGVESDGRIKLQIWEADQIRTPSNKRNNDANAKERVVLGVEINEFRQRMKIYAATRTGLTGTARDEDIAPIDVLHPRLGIEQVFHVYSPSRSSQTRGASALYPAFSVADYFEDINFAKLVQSFVCSCIGFVEEVPKDDDEIERDKPTTDTTDAEDPAAYLGLRDRIMEEIFPGARFKTKPGRKLVPFSPSTPNPEFFQHAKLMLQLIGINLGLPLVMLLMDASETNFSGWRGAVEEAKNGFIDNQTMMICCLLRPFYRLWLATEIARGRITPPANVSNPFRHEWRGRAWPYIEPLKDANAQSYRMRNLLGSPRRIHMEMSQDWETEIDHTVEDNSYAIFAALKEADRLTKRCKSRGIDIPGDVLPWQYFLSLPTLDRVSGSMVIDPSGGGDAIPAKPPAKKPPAQGAVK